MSYEHAPAADFTLGFDLPRAGARGRLVRLDAVSARALSAHALPEAAGRIAAEALVTAAMLGSALKLDGRLTVQTKSDGPLDMVTADYFGAEEDSGEPAGLRGFARMDAAALAELNEALPNFVKLVGDGVMAITIEPRRGEKNYQGITKLSPDGLGVSAETYFAQSEQLPTLIRIAAAPVYVPGTKSPHWRAGGMMVQATPDLPRDEDDWERLKLFLATVEDFELVDTALSAETLLWRLFHEDEVRVHTANALAFRCDCARGRVASVLAAYSQAERDGLADADGIIRARCEFCGTVHEVTAAGLAKRE